MANALDIQFPGNISQVTSAARLRQVPITELRDADLFIVLELEGIFSFDAGSLAVDDGTTVIRPNSLTPLQAGRWLFSLDGFARGPKGETGGSVSSTGDFSVLSGQTIPDGARLLQTSGATRGIVVQDDTLNDATVAEFPRMMAKTANGKFFRRDEAVVNLAEVGINGDAANNTGAINEALAYLKRFGNDFDGVFRGTPRLKLPSATIPINRINLKQTVIIEGDGTGLEGGRGTILQCSATGGITVERRNTLNGVIVTSTQGGDASILRNFAMIGNAAGVDRDANPAISLKARASIDELLIDGFAGAGIRIVASFNGTGEDQGNANCFKIRNTTVYSCFDGVYIQGADANAGLLEGVNVNGCSAIGVYDNSFLGNTHVGHHTSNNGGGQGGRYTMVSHNGNRYSARIGQNALWSTEAPGTGLAWAFFESGGPIPGYVPAWVSGGQYIFGGCYVSTNRNARSVWLGCYVEGTQAPATIQWPAMVIGGLITNVGDSPGLSAEQGATRSDSFITGPAGIDRQGLSVYAQSTLRMKPNSTDLRMDWNNSDVNRPLDITGPGTSSPYGANTVYIRQSAAINPDALPDFLDQTAAVAGGLTRGRLYRNGADIKVVL